MEALAAGWSWMKTQRLGTHLERTQVDYPFRKMHGDGRNAREEGSITYWF